MQNLFGEILVKCSNVKKEKKREKWVTTEKWVNLLE